MDKPGAPVSDTAISAVRSNLSRPQRADAQRNRDRVLEAARDVFGADGSFASLDEIATARRRRYWDGLPAFRR